jgi:hypothetical protein
MATELEGEWALLPRAAAHLGVSVHTLRRRIKRGELESRQVPSRHGPAYEVWVATPEPLEAQAFSMDSQVHPRTPSQGNPYAGEASGFAVLVRDLVTENARLLERAIRAEERLLALEAATVRQGVLGGQQEPERTLPSAENLSTHTPPRRPWWRFWR